MAASAIGRRPHRVSRTARTSSEMKGLLAVRLPGASRSAGAGAPGHPAESREDDGQSRPVPPDFYRTQKARSRLPARWTRLPPADNAREWLHRRRLSSTQVRAERLVMGISSTRVSENVGLGGAPLSVSSPSCPAQAIETSPSRDLSMIQTRNSRNLTLVFVQENALNWQGPVGNPLSLLLISYTGKTPDNEQSRPPAR